MGDKELIEKIKSLSFNFRPTAQERRVPGIRAVSNADEVRADDDIPDGYVTTDKNGKQITILHGDEDRRQVAEIIEAKQGG